MDIEDIWYCHMKIGIDARLINETGVGRYIRNLIEQLQTLDRKNQYIVYLPKNSFESFSLPNANWEKRLAIPRWHTLWEQVAMPFLFLQDRLDMLHVPYFNVPLLYPGKFIVTVHDLTILHFMTGKATTLPYPLYMLRKLGYRLALEFGLRRAIGVIVPSQTTKQEIIGHFHIPEAKIKVTYEGVDVSISNIKNQKSKIRLIQERYFLYVGNAYPHKNLETLVLAFADFIKSRKQGDTYALVLVGKEDFFYTRLKQEVREKGLERAILFFGQADDTSLHNLYMHAEALVFPSFMEGFGLPALEALSLGTPVIVSDIPVFHEILKNFPYYIDPHNKEDISKSFSDIREKKKNKMKERKNEITTLLKRYSWKQLGIDTISLYTSLGSPSTHL